MTNWDDEEEETQFTGNSKWDDEEDSDEPLAESWDASDSDDENKNPVTVAPVKKKVPLKQRIAEREAQKAKEKEEAQRALEEEESPADRRERLRQAEIEADLNNAADLFSGAVSITDEEKKELESTQETDISTLAVFKPRTKQDFEELQTKLGPLLAGLSDNAQYNTTFLPAFIKSLVAPLNGEQVKKLTSTLTAVSNEKIREEKAAEKTGKTKKKSKPGLSNASAKIDDAVDTTNYSRYDEFDDFM
ncbi:eukaryotic translation initiation factor 3 subunit J [Lipomyces japonicus]|uniref:eukaryotic translation initiation factor 3 subunit J n=1 Tax=Lipomyces japonicus TaxID=56871 RepID=UPI0034CF320B